MHGQHFYPLDKIYSGYLYQQITRESNLLIRRMSQVSTHKCIVCFQSVSQHIAHTFFWQTKTLNSCLVLFFFSLSTGVYFTISYSYNKHFLLQCKKSLYLFAITGGRRVHKLFTDCYNQSVKKAKKKRI